MTLQFSSLSFSNVMHVVILTALDFTEAIKSIFGQVGQDIEDHFYYLSEKIDEFEVENANKDIIRIEIENCEYYF